VEAFNGILTSLPPVEGVRETELMVTANERMDVPGGGVSGTAASVRFSDALPPPPPPPCFVPLQEVSEKIAAMATRTTLRLEFMHIPLREIGRATGRRWLESPTTL